jgi:leader peptidase (prepilin peptidase)/N-methyltransferase
MTLADALQASPLLLTGSVFLLSLLVGSFLNVVIHRLPIMLDRQWREHAQEMLQPATDGTTPVPAAAERFNLVVPRSRCPKCAAEIRAHQNIPVVSYLLLGGKCASCGVRISPRYPIVELGTAVLSAAVAWRFGFHWQLISWRSPRSTSTTRSSPTSSRCHCSGSACCSAWRGTRKCHP